MHGVQEKHFSYLHSAFALCSTGLCLRNMPSLHLGRAYTLLTHSSHRVFGRHFLSVQLSNNFLSEVLKVVQIKKPLINCSLCSHTRKWFRVRNLTTGCFWSPKTQYAINLSFTFLYTINPWCSV